MKLSQQLQFFKKNLQEILVLADIYNNAVESRIAGKDDADTKKDEAEYTKDRILKLSLSNKRLLELLEIKDEVK